MINHDMGTTVRLKQYHRIQQIDIRYSG